MNTKVDHPLQPGEAPWPWLKVELPNWTTGFDGTGGCWYARSPSYELDGLLIEADEPRELVERVRTQERITAAALAYFSEDISGGGFQASSVPIGTSGGVEFPIRPHVVGELAELPPNAGLPVAGEELKVEVGKVRAAKKPAQPTIPPATPALSPTDIGPPTLSYLPSPVEQARLKGFTGNVCPTCGSLDMVRNGTCEKCTNCGSTSGCS